MERTEAISYCRSGAETKSEKFLKLHNIVNIKDNKDCIFSDCMISWYWLYSSSEFQLNGALLIHPSNARQLNVLFVDVTAQYIKMCVGIGSVSRACCKRQSVLPKPVPMAHVCATHSHSQQTGQELATRPAGHISRAKPISPVLLNTSQCVFFGPRLPNAAQDRSESERESSCFRWQSCGYYV